MSVEKTASNVVTSSNLADFNAAKLGLAVDAPAEAEEKSEPVAESEKQSESEAGDEAKATDEKKPNPKLEKRFSEITKQRESARKEAQEEREKRESLETRIAELEGRNVPKKAVEVDEQPKPSQFNDAFEYAEALATYAAEKALKDRDRQDADKKANEERAKVLEGWNKRVADVRLDVPDYEEMIASSEAVVSDQIRDAILDSDVGPRILYHLAENPDIADKLAGMSVNAALREIGKMEVRFEKKDEQVEKKIVATKSKAPAPINPIKSGSAGVEVSVDTNGQFHGTYQQWKESRKAGKIR